MATTLDFTIVAKDRFTGTFDRLGREASGITRSLGQTGAAGAAMGTSVATGAATGALGAKKFGLALRAGVVGAAALAVAELGRLTFALAEDAASLDLLDRKARTVFGGQIGLVRDWADANASAMGLTDSQAIALAASFQDLLVPMGFTRREAAKMSTNVIGLSGALSEWSGGQRTAAEVADALSSAMLGEREQLKELGISIMEADVQARIAAKGQEKLTGKAREQAEAIATMELIFQKSKDAQKGFADGSDTLSRKLSKSRAELNSMGEDITRAVTPALTAIATVLADDVLPALSKFVSYLTGPFADGVVTSFAIQAKAVLGFAKFFIDVFRDLTKFFTDWVGTQLQLAEKAFGWLPEVGPKLRGARKSFEEFAAGVDRSFDKAGNRIDGWNRTVQRMRDEVKLRADIRDLEKKLATARKRVTDKTLTKTREAKIKADISNLLIRVARARAALSRVRSRTVTLRINTIRSTYIRGRPLYLAQHGTPSAPPGMALVGEAGPELVRFRGGERVFNASETMRMLAGMSRNLTTRTSTQLAPTARAGRAGRPTPIVINFNGPVGSPNELRNWLVRALDDLDRAGRLRGFKTT